MLRLWARRTSNKTFCHICQSKSLGPHRSHCLSAPSTLFLQRSTRITEFRRACQQLLRPRVRADDHSGEVGRSQMDEPQTRANRRSAERTGTWDAFTWGLRRQGIPRRVVMCARLESAIRRPSVGECCLLRGRLHHGFRSRSRMRHRSDEQTRMTKVSSDDNRHETAGILVVAR